MLLRKHTRIVLKWHAKWKLKQSFQRFIVLYDQRFWWFNWRRQVSHRYVGSCLQNDDLQAGLPQYAESEAAQIEPAANKIQAFAATIPGFKNLTSGDQILRLKNSCLDVMVLQSGNRYIKVTEEDQSSTSGLKTQKISYMCSGWWWKQQTT